MKKHIREDIQIAFRDLLHEKGFEHITIRDICERAEISKTTFYRYFHDKYEVMNAHYQDLLLQVVLEGECHDFREMFCHLLTTASEQWPSIKKAFESTGYNSLENYIKMYSFDFSEAIVKACRGGKGFSEEERFQCELFDAGVAHIALKWIEGEYPLSPEKASDLLLAMLPESLRDLEWNDIRSILAYNGQDRT
ncbi:MAG: TetR/AcrR family transcriptional regulator [Clostridia bacterium]|nr:TetR/AcrR family transcriptional regulator [Clostridia bacterium]